MPHLIKTFCLERRVPRDQLQLGHAYVIHARNGKVGIWAHMPERVRPASQYGFKLRRVKFSNVFLDDEQDWEDCQHHGTAIPLHDLGPAPELEGDALLAWLEAKTKESEPWMKAFWEDFKGWNPWKEELADV